MVCIAGLCPLEENETYLAVNGIFTPISKSPSLRSSCYSN